MTRPLPPSRSSVCRLLLSLAGLLGAAACNSSTGTTSAGAPSAKASAVRVTTPGTPAAPAVSVAPSGSPLSRLVPPAQAVARTTTSLAIVPGVSFGPVALGETLADLEKAGLTVVRDDMRSKDFAHIDLPESTRDQPRRLNLRLCEDRIVDIRIDDLRKTVTPVTYAGNPIAPTTPFEEVARLFGNCLPEEHNIGGSNLACSGGGVILGHGMGEFLQLRVFPRGFDLHDTCEIATDDGSPVVLSEATRTKMLEKILVDRSISPYWHVDRPGRDPLRIVKTPLVPAVPLTMFGSPVVWIEAADARPGTAFLTVTRIDATRTRARLEYTYPIEGVTGTLTFRHQSPGDDWTVEKSEVRER